MTQYTPEQARHIAGCMERGAEMRNMGAPALRSLADQVEALTAENANILRASLYSADLATQAMEDVKELTAERDAIKQQAQIWKMEAETQKATVHEIYQLCTGATGEPGDWHGAEPVRALVADAARWRYLMSENDVDGYITGAGGAYWERGAASREQIEAAIDLLADAAPVVPASGALERAHELGFLRCAGWAQRDDLFSDVTSQAYRKDRSHDLATITTPPQAAPVAQLSEPLTDEQMDSIYRDVWTTVPHGKRLFEFGRRVVALAAAPTTPNNTTAFPGTSKKNTP